MRSHHRHYVNIAKSLGLTDVVIVHPRGKHPRLIASDNGQTVECTIGCSKPSDQRSRQNTEARIRRTIRRRRDGGGS